MPKYNILITTSSFDPDILDKLKTKGTDVVLNPFGRKLTEQEVTELIKEHQPVGMIAGVEPLTRNVLRSAQNLKVISRCGIGMDSVDLKAADEFGVKVLNTPDAPTIPVAELTIGMILTLLRRIHISDAAIRKGLWERPMGNLLNGKNVGIIGCGRIGSYLATLLTPFGCRILGYDVAAGKKKHIEMAPVDELLQKADIVTLHLPYSETTHHFMSRDRIHRMKQGAILVNAARGGIVDEKALYDALKNSRLGGAAVDCFEDEPYHGPLREFDNVILTAHIGSYAKEGRRLMESEAVENLINALSAEGILS